MAPPSQIQALERRIERLETAIGSQVRDRKRIRELVLEELRKTKRIEAWSFAFRNNLHYPSVEAFLGTLVKSGAIERAE